ncbi:MAG: ATP-binding protein [Myxococcota bacterium]
MWRNFSHKAVDFQGSIRYTRTMDYPRFVFPQLQHALSDTPVVFVRGPRQVGKSTLMRMLCSARSASAYVTLDDTTALAAAQTDPQGFLQQPGSPLIIDEAQRVPDLFLAIKNLVDRRRRPGQFILTGSADVLFLPRVADSLAGRMEILTLHPLSTSELRGKPTDWIEALFDPKQHEKLLDTASETRQARDTAAERIASGGYPEINKRTSLKRRQAWFRSYVTALLQRDARELAQITSMHRLEQLLRLLANRSAQLMNTEEIARTSGIAATTLRRYLILLQTLFLIHTRPAWCANRGRRLVKAPKLYGEDTGLLCYLLGLDAKGLINSPNWGPMLETFTMNEIRKHASWSDLAIRVYHYRTHSGCEVDVVLEAADGRIVGLEVKASGNVSRRNFSGLRKLAEHAGNRWTCGAVLYLGEQALRFGTGLYALPIPFS